MRKPLFLFILVSLSLLTFGQELHNKTVKRIHINEYFVQTGGVAGAYSKGSLNDFIILAPNSVLLNSNLIPSPQTDGPIFHQHNNYNSMFSVMLGFQFSDKQKTKYKNNIQLRLGITYSSNSTLAGGMYNTETKTFDTLTSSQTSQQIYVDSVITKSLGMNYNSDQLRLDGALIFRTNPEARWSLFSGIGLTAGVSFNAKTKIYYNKQIVIQNHRPNENRYFINSVDNYSVTEEFTNKNNFGFSAYIPLGIDFRIGKKNNFWKRTHIFYELRPSINVTYIPELRTVMNTYVQHGIGIKISM